MEWKMKEDKPCKRGIFKTPLQSLSSLSVEKIALENFPCPRSLLLRIVVSLLFLWKTARTNIVKRSILRPLVKVCPFGSIWTAPNTSRWNPSAGNGTLSVYPLPMYSRIRPCRSWYGLRKDWACSWTWVNLRCWAIQWRDDPLLRPLDSADRRILPYNDPVSGNRRSYLSWGRCRVQRYRWTPVLRPTNRQMP